MKNQGYYHKRAELGLKKHHDKVSGVKNAFAIIMVGSLMVTFLAVIAKWAMSEGNLPPRDQKMVNMGVMETNPPVLPEVTTQEEFLPAVESNRIQTVKFSVRPKLGQKPSSRKVDVGDSEVGK